MLGYFAFFIDPKFNISGFSLASNYFHFAGSLSCLSNPPTSSGSHMPEVQFQIHDDAEQVVCL
jgi:hypothetical protein